MVALYKRVDTLDRPTAGAESNTRSDVDPAVELIARESHFSVDDVEHLYVEEIAKLARGARIKGFLSIFALRHVRRMLLNRSIPKRTQPDPETGRVTGLQSGAGGGI